MWNLLSQCKKNPRRKEDTSKKILSFRSKKEGECDSTNLIVVGFNKEACRAACARMIFRDELPFTFVRVTPTGVAIRGAITVPAKMAPKSPKTMLQLRWHRRWQNAIGDVGVPYLATLERDLGGCKIPVDSSCASQRLSQRLYFI